MLSSSSSAFLLLAVSKLFYGAAAKLDPLPLVIWHGLGDNYDADGLKSVGNLAEQVNPGTYVYNVRLDDDPSADRTATFFGNLTTQLEKVCEDLANHPVLSSSPGGINALGFSQGGQFMRGYVERCNNPPVRNLVTFGSQHNGISEFQECDANDWLCKAAMGVMRSSTWSSFVQSRIVPAQYFRDPEDLASYLENSNFLADINNERASKNKAYAANLASLDKFAMYMFTEDTTMIPKESAWFAEFNRTSGIVTPLQQRDIWIEDWIGLRKLGEKDGLDFWTAKGRHMNLDDKILTKAFKEYFSPPKSDTTKLQGEL
ncbi:MAG: Palmitoyl-protein thioesterase 1 [Geoglossum umbratile]|nr:MAG: Palmitoyl-protein thioesterase 1 [Geoglossum umbratile]